MRKILKIENNRTTVNGTERVHSMKTVWWCIVDSETSRTLKIKHLGCTVYLDRKHRGTDARFYSNKPISVPKKDFAKAAKLGPKTLERMRQEAFSEAYSEFTSSLKNLKGTVSYFDKVRGSGMIRINELGISVNVYACNLKGAKTGFPETACVYLERDAEVVVDSIHSHCGAILKENSQGILFDQEAWESLDQDRLAFKCNDDGSFKNGLFG